MQAAKEKVIIRTNMFGRNKNAAKVELTVSNRTVVRVVLVTIAVFVALAMLRDLGHPLTLIFVSFYLALALNPAVNWVSRKLKIKRRAHASAIAYLAVITLLTALLIMLVPSLVRQTADFIETAPDTFRNLQDSQGFVGDLVRRFELREQINDFAASWSQHLDTGPIISMANRVVANLFSIVTVLVLTFMMLIEGPKWLEFIWKQYPKSKRGHAKELAGHMYGVVTSYVNGQVLVAAIGATFATVALFILTTIFDVTSVNPIAMGSIVFLINLIPYIGVFISTAVVTLFSLFASVPLAIAVLIFFVIYQQIENVSIQPYVQSRGLEMTPMLVFIAAILGVSFGGLLGALVAIPAAGCVRILVEDYLERKTDYRPTYNKED